MSRRNKTQHVVPAEHEGETIAAVKSHDAVILASVFLASLLVTFWLYGPALNGPFLFDDIGLPFYQPSFPHESFSAWIGGVRPLVFLTYWLNYQISGRETWSYHATGNILHAVNGVLVFALLRRIMVLQSVEHRHALICALTGALLFLVHPLQSESVAYIASRSELMCGMFTLAALVVFCNASGAPITWKRAVAIVMLYGCAVLSKEQAAVLPVLLFGLDLALWHRGAAQAFRHGVRLYGPLAIAGVLAVSSVFFLLSSSITAGFHVAGVRWYEYLFTQCRVWPWYIWLAVLPLRQSADYDFALSRTLAEHHAGFAALLLMGAAFGVMRTRVRYPLLYCGFLIFAGLLLPTSSLVPLQDLAAERRMYLPLVGLILMGAEFLSRVRRPELTGTAVAAYLVFCSILTQQRAAVWGSDIALWTDVIRSAPMKARGFTHLAYAYLRTGRCHDAVNAIRGADATVQQDAMVLASLGQAYACEHRLEEAAEAYERAVLREPSVGRMLALAEVYKRANRLRDAESMQNNALHYSPRNTYDQWMLRSQTGTRSRTSDSKHSEQPDR